MMSAEWRMMSDECRVTGRARRLRLFEQAVAAMDFAPAFGRLLVDDGPALSKFAARGLYEEVAARFVNADAVRAFEREADAVGARAGREAEVVFELFLVAVVFEINAGVDLREARARVVRDVRAPTRRVAADYVVALARLLVETCDRGPLVRADERHAKHSGLLRRGDGETGRR